MNFQKKMDSSNITRNSKEVLNKAKARNKLEDLKSDFFLRKLFNNLSEVKKLELIRYNKKLKQTLGININHYKINSEIYSSIEIEIIPKPNKIGNFIIPFGISNVDIYFNDNKNEKIQRIYISRKDKVTKINITINYLFDRFRQLFEDCKCIQSINFKKFYRTNITDMYGMFYGCSSLQEIHFNGFKTDNVIIMREMFSYCSSLKKLNLSSFNTNNVKDMELMFHHCSSLKELNLSNFNTSNVGNMIGMFSYCSSLEEINLTNFNTSNVGDMFGMFSYCSSLKKLDISNFNLSYRGKMNYMFAFCSSLEKLNVFKLNTDNIETITKMFFGCSSLKELYISNLNKKDLLENIINKLKGCSNELKMKVKDDIKNIIR